MTSCTDKPVEDQPVSMPEQTITPKVQERKKTNDVSYDEVTFTTLDSKEIKLGDYKGKRILLNLWATWCGPCVAEMPSLNRAFKELKDDNYVFLVASNEKMAKINGFSAATNFDFELIKADDMFQPFDIRAIPTTMVFDTEGNIAMKITGGRAWDSESMLNQLKSVK